jgi:non-homologous end joining protein Ku
MHHSFWIETVALITDNPKSIAAASSIPKNRIQDRCRHRDAAKHIVEQKSGHFEPKKFEDHYEGALQELLEKKQKGQPIAAPRKQAPSNVVNLMDALRASLKSTAAAGGTSKPSRPPAKKAAKSRRKAS